jgi:hypothetical protein
MMTFQIRQLCQVGLVLSGLPSHLRQATATASQAASAFALEGDQHLCTLVAGRLLSPSTSAPPEVAYLAVSSRAGAADR